MKFGMNGSVLRSWLIFRPYRHLLTLIGRVCYNVKGITDFFSFIKEAFHGKTFKSEFKKQQKNN